MFLFGAGVYLAVFASPDLCRALSPQLRRAAIGASLIAFVSALAWLAMEAASMSDDWSAAVDTDVLRDVLASTAFGAVWQGRLALGLVTILALVVTRAGNWRAPTLLAGLWLASLGLVDHAAMQGGGVGLAHRVNDAVHLLTAGGWLGGLLPFSMCLESDAARTHPSAASVAMLRYSAVGHFAVVLIVATGAVNVALTTHAVPWPLSSPYRALLTAKIGVVLLMIALAIVNRYVLLPAVDDAPCAARTLKTFALVELGLALAAVALVSYFGLLDPA